jgi:formylglycine-generating enzyme required for sulfatase activity
VSAADFHQFLTDAPADVDAMMIDCIDPCFIVQHANGFRLRPGCGDFPMIQVSFWGAAAYCNWLSQVEGFPWAYDMRSRTAQPAAGGYRLPTEAEWEAACRAGYPDGSAPDPDTCNSADAGQACRLRDASVTQAGNFLPGHRAPVPVGSLPADRAGLCEMLGNVREWCQDRFGFYHPGLQRNPRGASRGPFRAVRGGSFIDPAATLGPANRMGALEDTRCEVYGFRVARYQ